MSLPRGPKNRNQWGKYHPDQRPFNERPMLRLLAQISNERDNLGRVNTQLLEALKFAENWVATFLPDQGPAEDNLLKHLRSAIQAAKEKQASESPTNG